MIVSKDKSSFLKNFFQYSPSQAFLLSRPDQDFEDLLVRHILCEKKNFCKKCDPCLSESFFGIKTFEGDSLKIEDARTIQAQASQTSIYGTKIFLIKTSAMAPDAQATLLKTLEEPFPDTYFIVSQISNLELSRPLLSRLTVFEPGVSLRQEEEKTFKLSLEDLPSLSQNREEVEKVFKDAENWIESRLHASQEISPALTNFIDEYFEIKRRFFEKTYPLKMLLEHLAISKYYLK